MDWEIVKALAPYVVAIIAIVGTFISTLLAQKNWQKQFTAQQSVLLFNKRIELANELPSKLFEIWGHYLELFSKSRLAETLGILNSEGREFKVEVIESLYKDQADAGKAVQKSVNEFLGLAFLTKAFFNEEIMIECSQSFNRINEIYQQQQADAPAFRDSLKECVSPGTSYEQVLIKMETVLSERLQTLSSDISARIGTLASMMVNYTKKSEKN